MSYFGNKIKILRKKNGLSQEEFAGILRENYNLGTDRAMVSKWENDFQRPSVETVADIADFFGVSIDSIVSKEFSKNDGRLLRRYVVGNDIQKNNCGRYIHAPYDMDADFCVCVCDDTLAAQGFVCGDKIYGVAEKKLCDGDKAVLCVHGKIEIRTVYFDNKVMVFVGENSACRPIRLKGGHDGVQIIGKPTALHRLF